MASLEILDGPEKGTLVPLTRDQTVLGRYNSCDFILDQPAASREHAQILCRDGIYYLEDLDSRNGTYVNERRVESRVRLAHHDLIRICDFLCRFIEVAPLPTPVPTLLLEPEPEGDDSSTVEVSVSSDEVQLDAHSGERLQALLDISNQLSKTLDPDALFAALVDRLFELYRQAERGFVLIRDEATGNLVPRVLRTRDGKGAASRYTASIVRQCLETGKGFLSGHSVSPPRNDDSTDFRTRSVLCVPLTLPDGRPFGVLQLDTRDALHKFVVDDLVFLMGVARQAAVALENAWLHRDQLVREKLRRDMAVARQVQLGILPRRLPAIPGYAFFADYEPALGVGGDYYDFVPLPDGRLAVALGDVAGKGVPAALLMAKLASEVRSCLLTEPDLAAALARLNELLVPLTGTTGRFVSLAVAILDPAAHDLTLAGAGQPMFYIYRADGVLEDGLPAAAVGVPLGLAEGWTYATHRVNLKPGDCLVALTDSVVEGRNERGEPLGRAGVEAALVGEPLSPQGIGERIVTAVKQHAGGIALPDDVTIVCAGRPGADSLAEWGRVAADLRASRDTQLRTWGPLKSDTVGRYLTGTADAAELAAVEDALAQHPELRPLLGLLRVALADG